MLTALPLLAASLAANATTQDPVPIAEWRGFYAITVFNSDAPCIVSIDEYGRGITDCMGLGRYSVTVSNEFIDGEWGHRWQITGTEMSVLFRAGSWKFMVGPTCDKNPITACNEQAFIFAANPEDACRQAAQGDPIYRAWPKTSDLQHALWFSSDSTTWNHFSDSTDTDHFVSFQCTIARVDYSGVSLIVDEFTYWGRGECRGVSCTSPMFRKYPRYSYFGINVPADDPSDGYFVEGTASGDFGVVQEIPISIERLTDCIECEPLWDPQL